MLLGFAAAPAAHAAFSGQAAAALPVGTAVVGSPTTVSVMPVCGNKKTLTLTVSVKETVPYANRLDVSIVSGIESMTATQPISTAGTHSLAVSAAKGNSVDFTYTVRGLYTPPGSANTWRSAAPLTRTVTCT